MNHRPEEIDLETDHLDMSSLETWTLVGADGQPFQSSKPGALGGYRRTRIYGRLDCPSARAALARGGYKDHRVFFASVVDAVMAGYRPCARCLPEAYKSWKDGHVWPIYILL